MWPCQGRLELIDLYYGSRLTLCNGLTLRNSFKLDIIKWRLPKFSVIEGHKLQKFKDE